jgi:hypothetical protein
MSRFQSALRASAVVALSLAFAPLAHAQATRTWVSGVGDDANPCSRTAPCKTFAGAISKTATGGEINVLDPGGFGGVTITKSITISSEGFEAGVLVSGTNAIIINATTTSNVVLRGLDIEGLGTGLVGIKVLGGLGSLHVENCTINAFRGTNGSGIEIATSTAGATTEVFIKDTTVRNNGFGTGGGIFINPSGTAVVRTALENVRIENNTFGFKALGTANTAVHHSAATGNSVAGFQSTVATTALNIEDTIIAANATGIACTLGTVRVGNSAIFGNITAVTGGGTCSTFGNVDADNVIVPPFVAGADQ